MPVTTRELGSGITKRAEKRLSEPTTAAELHAFFKDIGTTLQKTLASIEEGAGTDLEKAKLPSVYGRYQLSVQKGWKPLTDNAPRLETGVRYVSGLWPIAKAEGYAHDSRVGYAAQILDHVGKLRRHLARGSIEEAVLGGIRLGVLLQEAQMKWRWERHALRGVGTVRAARSGHAAKHGTADEKRRRWQKLVEDLNGELARGVKKTAAYALVAARHGVSAKTVQRAINYLQKT